MGSEAELDPKYLLCPGLGTGGSSHGGMGCSRVTAHPVLPQHTQPRAVWVPMPPRAGGTGGGGAQPGGPHAPSPTLSSLSAHPHPGCKQQMTRSTAMLETGSVIACSRF